MSEQESIFCIYYNFDEERFDVDLRDIDVLFRRIRSEYGSEFAIGSLMQLIGMLDYYKLYIISQVDI